MIEQMRSDEQEKRLASQAPATSSAATGSAQSQEGYWAYMQRQVQERTENLNFIGDSMDKTEENSARWATDVNKFVSKQKKKAVMGCRFTASLFKLNFLLIMFSDWK